MERLDPVGALARIPLLADLTSSLLLWLADEVRERRFGAGDVIVRQGDHGDTMFFVCGGWVQISVTWEDAHGFGEVVLHNMGPGQVFGELAVIDDLPRSASAIALEPVLCYELSRGSMERLLDRSPGFARALLTFLAERVRSADARVALEARDPLTNLPNRSILTEFYDRVSAGVARHGGVLSVVLLDVDGLKQINDNLGHGAGDLALRTVANALQESLRKMDLAVRYGGDEFALLLPNSTEEGARQVTARVNKTLAATASVTTPVRVSFGIATATCKPGEEPPALSQLLAQADQVLYEEKDRHHRGME